MSKLLIGQRVRFSPSAPEWKMSYCLDGVSVGDIGIVVEEPEDGDVGVNFTRQDGTVCEQFYAFVEDVEVIDEN